MQSQRTAYFNRRPEERRWVRTIPRRRRRLVLAVLLVGMVGGCAAAPPMVVVEEQSWAGRVDGMVTGPMRLTLQIGQADGGARPVAGKVLITMETTAGGYGKGEVNAMLTGQMAGGVIEAEFKGHAFVADGHTSVDGRLDGTLSADDGRGTWTLRTPSEAGSLSGGWVLQRVP